MKFLLTIASVMLTLQSASAASTWSHVRCSDGFTFMDMKLDSKHQLTVETETTKTFLLNLKCEVPNLEEPIFNCSNTSNLNFKSQLRTEKGFAKDADYPIETKLILFHLRYYYEDAQGSTKAMEKSFEFKYENCVAN